MSARERTARLLEIPLDTMRHCGYSLFGCLVQAIASSEQPMYFLSLAMPTAPSLRAWMV